MKDLVTKLVDLLNSLKGKKPVVIGIVSVIFILGYFGVQKGYITQDMLDMDFITKQVESFFPTDTLSIPVDTLKTNVIDSLKIN